MNKLFLFFLIACYSFSNAQTKREFEVNFATDSYTLDSDETKKLNTFIQSLRDNPKNYTVAIAGHTDSVGDLAYNAVLSDNRANAIASIFKNKGFAEFKVLTSGRGEVHPIATNENESGKAQNRRVKIIVTEDLKKLNSIGGIEIKETFYKIDSQKKETVSYESGTKITIPENAFVDKNGKTVTGKVDLSYIEYRDPIDFILGDIPMNHDGGHFNSGGMYKILAYQNGKPIYLKKGKEINIDFALTDNLPEMNFYSYDTINKKWSELSKLTGKSTGEKIESDVTTIAFMSSANTIIPDRTSACYGDNCYMLQNTISLGIKLAKSENSAYEDYLVDKKVRDSLIASTKTNWLIQQQKADSLFALKNKKRAKQIVSEIKGHEEVIANQQKELESIPTKIEKTKPYFVVHKTAEKKFKIDLKAIYNIETVNFSNTEWKSENEINPEIFEKQWDTCIIKKGPSDNELAKQTAEYTITLKKDGQTSVIDGLKFSNNKMSNEKMFIASMNKARVFQMGKIQKLKNQQIALQRGIEHEKQKIDALKREKDPSKGKGDSISLSYDHPMKCFWQNSKVYMDEEELALSIDDWFRYFDSHKKQMKARYENITLDETCKKRIEQQQRSDNARKNASEFVQSLSISNLGIYNCDQVSRMRQPIYANISKYQSEDGTEIAPVFIYILDSEINGIIQYYTPFRFAFNATSRNSLIAFDGKDSYVINAENFINSVNSKVLKLRKVENLKSKEKLMTML